MEKLVELLRVDPDNRFVLRDEPLVDHVDRDPKSRHRGALAAPRLQEVEAALLDGELDVLHLPVVLLEPAHRLDELGVRLREEVFHLGEGLRGADSRDDVLTLRVDEELAPWPRLARGRVAGESHAGARRLALVPEDHLDDVNGRPEVVRDAVRVPVDLSAWRVPRVEDRADRGRELVAGVLREVLPGALPVDLLESADERLQV